MPLILLMWWILVGIVLAVPHTLLAQGNVRHGIVMVVILPGAALLLLSNRVVTHVLRRGDNTSVFRGWPDMFCWVVWAYFYMPVILNGASVLMRWTGYETIGRYVFQARYISQPVILLGLMFYAALFVGVTSLRQRFGGRGTPPTGRPPDILDQDVNRMDGRRDESTGDSPTAPQFIGA